MAALTGATIANTYTEILRMGNATLHATTGYYIKDSADTNSALSIATTRVGIGTNAPADILEVQGTGHAHISIDSATDYDAGLKLRENGTEKWFIYNNGDDSDKLYINDDGATRVVIDQNGQIGIGTTAPGRLLEVSGTGNAATIEINSIGTGNGRLIFSDDGDTVAKYEYSSDHMYTDAGGHVWQSADGSVEYMRILTPGRVGIGTNSPSETLQINHAAADSDGGILIVNEETTIGDDAFLGGIGFDGNDGNIPSTVGEACACIISRSTEAHSASAKGASLLFGTTANTTADDQTTPIHLCIDDTGYVGIGNANTSPLSILDVRTVAGTTILVQTTAQTDTNYARVQCKSVQASTSNTVYAEIGNYQHSATATDGPVGYIRLMPSDRAVSAYLWVEDDDTLKGSSDITHIGTTSGVEFGGAVSSDERLKDIDSSPFPYGLSDINKLTPIKFQFNNKINKVDQLGFGAQSVRDIISEPVKDTGICIDGYTETNDEDADNGMGDIANQTANSTGKEGRLSLDYNQLIPVLVKAIQELTAKVEALENNNKQGDSSNEQDQEQSAGSGDSGGDASSESSGEDSGGADGSSSDSSGADESGADSSESGSDSSSDSSVEGSEDAGSSGSDASDDSEGGSGEDDSSGEGEPSEEWTKDQLKAYMDENSIEYNSGDTKQDLLDKITLAGEGPDEG